jgi:hypothetical protein
MADSFVSPVSESSTPSPPVPIHVSPLVQSKLSAAKFQPLHTLHTDDVNGEAWLLCRPVTDVEAVVPQLCTIHVKIIDENVHPRPAVPAPSEVSEDLDEYSAKLVTPMHFVDRLPPSFVDVWSFRMDSRSLCTIWCNFRVFPPLVGPALPAFRRNSSVRGIAAVRPFTRAKKWALQLCALVGKMYQTRSDRVVLQKSAVLLGFDGTLSIDVTAASPFSSVCCVGSVLLQFC